MQRVKGHGNQGKASLFIRHLCIVSLVRRFQLQQVEVVYEG